MEVDAQRLAGSSGTNTSGGRIGDVVAQRADPAAIAWLRKEGEQVRELLQLQTSTSTDNKSSLSEDQHKLVDLKRFRASLHAICQYVDIENDVLAAKMPSTKPPATAGELMPEVNSKQDRLAKLQSQIQAKEWQLQTLGASFKRKHDESRQSSWSARCYNSQIFLRAVRRWLR